MTSNDAAQEGLQHLQAAAKEMIGAARAFLDAAEHLVSDPEAVTTLVADLSNLARTFTPSRSAASGDDDAPGVERIPVT